MLRLKRRGKPAPPREVDISSVAQLGFDYTIRYSRRKTTCIQVKNGEVRLAAPYRTPQRDLHNWMESKAHWIRSKLETQRQRQAQIPERSYLDGETMPLMDERLTLVSATHGDRRRRPRANRQGRELVLSTAPGDTAPERLRSALEEWYRAEAERILAEKTRYRCRQLGVTVSAIKLRNTRSKWGHCTHDGIIQYNWRIVLAPEAVVDYLVAHECCHRVHFDHSRDFWQLVERHCPDYARQRRWLHEYGNTLVI